MLLIYLGIICLTPFSQRICGVLIPSCILYAFWLHPLTPMWYTIHGPLLLRFHLPWHFLVSFSHTRFLVSCFAGRWQESKGREGVRAESGFTSSCLGSEQWNSEGRRDRDQRCLVRACMKDSTTVKISFTFLHWARNFCSVLFPSIPQGPSPPWLGIS